MSDTRTTTFIDALHTLERDGDVEPIAALFGDDAVVGNSTLGRRFRGRDGARDFWTAYRGSFASIRSDFADVIAAGDAAALEWRSRGELSGGDPFTYEGVSIIDWEGDRITRFAAYFNAMEL
jgi:ketosteroid isomerase-like protein